MPESISLRLLDALADRLHVDREPGAFAAELRRLALPEDTAPLLVEALVDGAARLQVAFPVRRSHPLSGLADAVRDEVLPIVLAGMGRGAAEAALLTGREGDELVGRVFSADGERPLRASAGRLRGALGWTEDAPVALLAPAALGSGDGGHGHEHLSPMGRFWQLVREERGSIGLVYLYAALSGLLTLTLPLGFEFIISLVAGGLFLQPVILLMLGVVLGTAASGGLQVMQLWVVEMLQQRLFARMALEFSFRVPRLSSTAVARLSLPEQMNRFFEVIAVQKSLGKLLTDTTTAALTVVFGLLLLAFYHPYFMLASLVLTLGLWGLVRWTGRRGLETSIQESKYKYRAVHWLEQLGAATTAFKFAPRSDLPVARMDDIVTGYLRYRGKHFRVLIEQAVAMVVFKTAITGGLLVVGALLVVNRSITLGQFVASELVILLLLSGVEKLIFSLSTIYDVLTSLDKLGHVRDLPLERRGGLALPPREGGMAVELRDVSFTYPGAGEPALRRLSLALRAGERVAITGVDGSGESTLLRLFAGLQEEYTGTLLADGLTYRDLDPTAFRAQVGQYLSSTDLFDGTIEENISVGRREVGPAEVLEALEVAGALSLVQAMPQGLATPVTDGGRGLPSSLVARLLFAQAIAGRPRLLLCDAFFDQLDVSLRGRIAQVLTDRARTWTMVTVTHDPTLLALCDRVIVLKDGRLHAEGPFVEIVDDPYLRTVLPTTAPAALPGGR